MQDAQIIYTVAANGDVLVQLETVHEKITLISQRVVENTDDFTLECLTQEEPTGGPDKINVTPALLVESSAPGAKNMIINWTSREGAHGQEKPKKRRITSTRVETK